MVCLHANYSGTSKTACKVSCVPDLLLSKYYEHQCVWHGLGGHLEIHHNHRYVCPDDRLRLSDMYLPHLFWKKEKIFVLMSLSGANRLLPNGKIHSGMSTWGWRTVQMCCDYLNAPDCI